MSELNTLPGIAGVILSHLSLLETVHAVMDRSLCSPIASLSDECFSFRRS